MKRSFGTLPFKTEPTMRLVFFIFLSFYCAQQYKNTKYKIKHNNPINPKIIPLRENPENIFCALYIVSQKQILRKVRQHFVLILAFLI